jgi:putative ABC transport system substrate-binding protein
VLGGVAAWPLQALAQRSGNVPIVGVLAPGTASIWGSRDSSLRKRLSELGWTDGSTIAIETRYADGRTERFAEVAQELVNLKVDVIITAGTLPVLAAKRATAEIPILFAGVGNPVEAGLVATLAQPGGNVTGVSNQTPELAGKRIELLRGLLPTLRRLAILGNTETASGAQEMAEAEAAATTFGLAAIKLVVRRTEEIAPAFDGVGERADAPYVVTDPLIGTNQTLINTLALKARLPTMHGQNDFVMTGGLMSYGSNLPDAFRRVAEFVDRILRGAKPADIPVEQPTRFELAINLKTAKALGLAVPATLTAMADDVIE